MYQHLASIQDSAPPSIIGLRAWSMRMEALGIGARLKFCVIGRMRVDMQDTPGQPPARASSPAPSSGGGQPWRAAAGRRAVSQRPERAWHLCGPTLTVLWCCS